MHYVWTHFSFKIGQKPKIKLFCVKSILNLFLLLFSLESNNSLSLNDSHKKIVLNRGFKFVHTSQQLHMWVGVVSFSD